LSCAGNPHISEGNRFLLSSPQKPTQEFPPSALQPLQQLDIPDRLQAHHQLQTWKNPKYLNQQWHLYVHDAQRSISTRYIRQTLDQISN
jgi:hypothetical protein